MPWPSEADVIPPTGAPGGGGAGQPLANAHVEAHQRLKTTAEAMQASFGTGSPVISVADLRDRLGLPAPVTSGSTVQTHTDTFGQLWIAKSGVNGGQWRRPADVLHCHVYRNAAWVWTVSPNWGIMTFDNRNWDPYGMLDGPGSQFVAPIPGFYGLYWQATVYSNPGAWIQVSVTGAGGGMFGNATAQVAISPPVYVTAVVDVPMNLVAGGILQARYQTGGGGAPAGVTNPFTKAYFRYLGSGS
jgi:hypothetical protein